MRVIRSILASIIALFALAFTFYAINNGMSGNVVNDEIGFSAGEFTVHDLGLSLSEDLAKVSYNVKEEKNIDRKLQVYYEVYDSEGNVYSSGNNNIFVEAGSDQKFGFSFKAKSYSGTLMVKVYDENSKSFSTVSFDNNKITGRVITEDRIKSAGWFILFMFFLVILFLIFKRVSKRKYFKTFSKKHNSGFIKMDMG